MKKVEVYDIEAEELEALSNSLSDEVGYYVDKAQVVEALVAAVKDWDIDLSRYV